MAVRKARPNRKPAPAAEPKARTVRRAPVATQYSLPTERTWPGEDIREYSLLLYGVPGIGKTTFFASFPDTIYLLTEPGKPSGAYVFPVPDWKAMEAAVKLLESDQSRFKNVVIDTLDESYEMCMRHVCKAAGVDHPHDANDYGKTWDIVTRGFKDVFARIRRTGRGLYLTSHAKEGTIKSSSGEGYTRIQPSLTGKAGAKVLALVDFIFFIDYYRVGNRTQRLVCTSGTELVVGKQRPIGRKAIQLPQYIALPDDPRDDYEMFAAAFRGEAEGVEPELVTASKMSTKTVTAQLDTERDKKKAAKARARGRRGE